MGSPQQLRPSVVIMSDAETRRLNQFVAKVGCLRIACERLGIGRMTFDAAREYGRMMGTTRTKILASLDRVEAEA